MVPWTSGKNCGFQVFICNFNNFISQLDFQKVYVEPHLLNFKFLDSKNKHANNKNFRKKTCIYKKRMLKSFAMPLCIFVEQDVELFFIFQP